MYSIKEKILSLESALKRVNAWRVKNNRIVFTNGCFDIIHAGHVFYLEKARQMGDRLIVGLNSDTSVRQIKGENRPVNDEDARAAVLAAMEFVDMVVVFAEETPLKLIEAVSPDFLIKGGDYVPEEIVGYDHVKKNGGEIITIPLLKGYSTTSTIERLRD